MNTKTLILAILTGLSSACGDLSSDSKKETFTYDFSHDGCKTGKKSFDSKADYCSALQDDSANNGCAAESRRRLWKQKCS